MNNKSRPEQPVTLNISNKRRRSITKISVTKPNKKKSKSPSKKKRSSSKSKQNKYVPGEYIYDTKGQMAEIKYIGQCHKGSGNWYGIEYVDGSLGKHNGTINGKTYFHGMDRRCDMIRGDKIRSKVTMKSIPNKSSKSKYNSPPRKVRPDRIKYHNRHQRAKSDVSDIKSVSMANLANNFSDNYFKKKNINDAYYRAQNRKRLGLNTNNSNSTKSQSRHKRHISQPAKNGSIASKSREEKVYHGNTHRRYRPKPKQVKTVKKEKYKGNKYIMAMEQESQKKRHERIGSIKKDKKRITKQKHERKSSQLQEIMKSKELKREELSKLNEEHKLRELERIQLAKQKSKHRMNLNRHRSNSEHSDSPYKDRPRVTFNTPDINKMNKIRSTPDIDIPSAHPLNLSDLSPVHKVNQPLINEKVPPMSLLSQISAPDDDIHDNMEDLEPETPQCDDVDIGDLKNMTLTAIIRKEEEKEQEPKAAVDISAKFNINKISSNKPLLNASATPLATPSYSCDSEMTPNTPVPSDFPMIPATTTNTRNSIIDLPAITQDHIITLDYNYDNDNNDNNTDSVDTDDTDIESIEMPESPRINGQVRSYSDSDLKSTIANKHPLNPLISSHSAPKSQNPPKRNIMEPMVAVNSDSTLILQELLDQPMTELLSSADEYSSMNNSPSPTPMSMLPSPTKTRRRPLPLITIHSNKSDGVLLEDGEPPFDIEQTPDIVTDDEWKTPDSDRDESMFHFPMSHGLRTRSSSCSDAKTNLLKRADTAPLFNNNDAEDTDYWIKQYNKMNKMNKEMSKTQNEIERKMKLIIKEDQADSVDNNDLSHTGSLKPKVPSMTISKSYDDRPKTKESKEETKEKEEDDDSFYFPMSSGRARPRSSSEATSPSSMLKRVESAPIITNDDKGTDYWIKQYNKSLKKKKAKSKSKSKKKSKKKSKLLRSSTPKHSTSPRKTKTSQLPSDVDTTENPVKPKQINLPKPSKPVLKLTNSNSNKSNKRKKSNPILPALNDDISDIQSTTSVFSNFSNDTISVESMAYAKSESAISSLLSSPNTSAGTTPNTDNDVTNFGHFFNQDYNNNPQTKEMAKALHAAAYQSKYGGYPFKRKRENYIKQRFTGIVRIGHRYLLRDGRVGVVRYVNGTRFAPGTWIGFELDKSEGEHDGTVNNVRYFHCANMYGTFVKKSQIAQYIARDTTKSLSREQLKYMNASK